MDIDKILSNIDAMRAFQAEPVPDMSIEQRLRAFMADIDGERWHNAHIFAAMLPTGTEVYIALCLLGSPASGEIAWCVISEKADGTLALAAPIPIAERDEQDDDGGGVATLPRPATDAEQFYLDERQCLERIIPALLEARDIVAASGRVKPKRKKRIRHELAHACEHLTMYLEQLRRSA